MPHSKAKKSRAMVIAIASGFIVVVAGILWAITNASTANTLYSYTLDGSSAVVSNAAASNNNVNMTLAGNWSQSAFGVHFTGNTTNQQSVGYAKPASGYTLDVAANQSVGSIVKFKYQAPVGRSCFSDSSNISQIGKFASKTAQVKIQFSNCGNNSSQVFIQCRLAGSNTGTGELPKTNPQPMVNGSVYIAKCMKHPDPSSGNGTMTLSVTKIDEANGNTNTSNNFSIARPGTMRSTQYLSVGQKYPLPSISNNTDQFVGDIAKIAYCKASTVADVEACLDAEVPATAGAPTEEEPPVPDPEPTPPTTTELITNPGIETSKSGWDGYWGSTSKVSVTRSTAVAHTGVASLEVRGKANNFNGGFKDKPTWVTNTTAGKVYTASLWVKPGLVNQKINLLLREKNGSTVVATRTYSLTAANTNWQQLAGAITPGGSGRTIDFIVYANDVDTGEVFYADDLSLITTN